MIGSTKKGAILGYITIFINILTGLLYTPWMIRQIGVTDYGLYTLISTFISYFLLDFGLGSAVSRFVSKYKEEGRFDKISELLGVVVKVFAIIDLIVFILLTICYFFISDIFTSFSASEIEKFKVIYCIAGFFSILTFPFTYLNGILIAYEKFVCLKTCDLFCRVLIVLFVVICLLNGYGLYSLVFVNSIVGIIIVAIKLIYLYRRVNLRIDLRYFNKELLFKLLKFSSWIFVIAVSSRLMYNIIPTLLGRYCSADEVAKFSIAMMIEAYLYTFAGAINGLFLPRVMRITLREQDGKELTKLMIKVGRIQLIVVGAIIIGFIVMGKLFINLWLGRGFEVSYWVTLCLIVPGIVSLIEEIGNTALIATNEMRIRAYIYMVSAAISILAGYFLIPSLGALGAGISVNFSLVFCHIIAMNILYDKKLHIDIWSFFKSTLLRFIPIVIICVLIVYTVSKFIEFVGWYGMIVEVLLFGAIYLPLIWWLYLNREEKLLLLDMFHKQQ